MSALDELFGLRGETAYVTGASSGLGREAARALAKAGANLGLVARRREQLEETAAALAEFGGTCHVAPADVTRRDEIERSFDEVEAALGPARIVVSAAGISPLGRAEQHSREKWDRALAVNLTASLEVSQVAALRMIERASGGTIIHVSSVMGSHANPVHRAVGYAATKGALDNLTRQLAVEWARHDIRVNAVAPAYFPTEMTVDPRHGDIAPDQQERMRTFTPMERVGRDGELESAVLFLAAPASSYVTGVILPVDGGWTAW